MSKAMETAVRFAVNGSVASCERYGNGHINETYLVVTDKGTRYILQRINDNIFTNVSGLMDNIRRVTEYLAAHGTLSLTLVPTVEGAKWLDGGKGDCWRMYDFVENSLCLEAAESAEDFAISAVGFGGFQAQLKDYPAAELFETIPHFHDTPDRYRQLHEAIDGDAARRAAEVGEEIAFALAREESAGLLMQLQREGKIPLRVTHNDTKLNNVLLNAQTRRPLCVIDLDTVMPGLAAFDFGDSIRFGASTAKEDEKDLSKVQMSLALFEAYTKGFLSACGSDLTEAEVKTLPDGARLMTLECGIRFLADYLNGDVYFRTSYAGQNLDRCRTQFKLVKDMEEKRAAMDAIVEACRKEM